MTEVFRAVRADVPAIAGVLARAFFSDPVASFIFKDPTRRLRDLEIFFKLQLRHAYLPSGEVFTTANRSGAALWIPPNPPGLRVRDVIAHMRLVPLLGKRLALAHQVTRFLAERHPRERHYYLGTLGTDPQLQRRGIGAMLLGPVLERCDTSQVVAYLECSRLSNVAFYESHGFLVASEVRLPMGGPELWLMRRSPRV